MTRPRLLDLFCGAGGAAMGYHLAGFDVVGVDIRPQPRFPFEFHQADALTFPLDGFDVIHASPPCQGYSEATPEATRGNHTRLIPAVRERLQVAGVPYVIENVEGARHELIDPVLLCGSMFEMQIRRHRYFESNLPLPVQPCRHRDQGQIYSITGTSYANGQNRNGTKPGTVAMAQRVMGIDWMTIKELSQAIPPAYAYYIACAATRHPAPGAGDEGVQDA